MKTKYNVRVMFNTGDVELIKVQASTLVDAKIKTKEKYKSDMRGLKRVLVQINY